MKKKWIILLSCAAAAVLFSFASVYANGDDDQSSGILSVYSEECPEDVLAYARRRFPAFLESVVQDSASDYVGRGAYLGTPFTMVGAGQDNKVYTFPVVYRDKFAATFCVCRIGVSEAGEYSHAGTLSGEFSDALNDLQRSHSDSGTILLYCDNGNCYAKAGDEIIFLLPDMEGRAPRGIDPESIDVSSLICVEPKTPLLTPSEANVPMRPSSAYLNLSIIETQGNDSWCGAYSTAAILRYLDGSSTVPTAGGLMSLIYRHPQSTHAFSINNTLSVAQAYGYNPTYEENSLNSGIVINQIDNNKPIYANIRRYDSDEDIYYYHAVVVRGYNRNTDTYSIWNPWYSRYYSMDMINKTYVTTSGLTYTWYSSVYDW